MRKKFLISFVILVFFILIILFILFFKGKNNSTSEVLKDEKNQNANETYNNRYFENEMINVIKNENANNQVANKNSGEEPNNKLIQEEKRKDNEKEKQVENSSNIQKKNNIVKSQEKSKQEDKKQVDKKNEKQENEKSVSSENDRQETQKEDIKEKKYDCLKQGHPISPGNTGKWFPTKEKAIEYFDKEQEKCEEKLLNGGTYEEYVASCPYGYQYWSCPYCKYYTIDFYKE